MPKPWDDTIKKLIKLDPAAFVRLIAPNARFVEALPPALQQEEVEMDGLLLTEINEEPLLIDAEVETYYNEKMPERLLRYNVITRVQRGLPVLSCVIHLLNDTAIRRSPLAWKVPGEQTILIFEYITIELSQYTPADIIALGAVGLLPLLPFTKGGKNREEITHMFNLIEQDTVADGQGKKELELIGFTFASLILVREDKQEQDWLIRRFRKMHEILRDTPIFQEILREGREEGEEKGRLETSRRWLVRVVEARFSELKPLAQRQVERIANPDILEDLMFQISSAKSANKVRQALLHWEEDYQ